MKWHEKEFADAAYKDSTAPNLGGALFVLVSIFVPRVYSVCLQNFLFEMK